MILPLGPQNVFVMNQGIRRQYHLMIASLCALSDIVPISRRLSAAAPADPLAAAAGAGHLGRVAFLLWYGWGAFRSAFSPQPAQAAAQELAQRRWRLVVTMLAFCWNPHVYLDTFVVLGSLAGS
ncbi:LysE family transporter [Serratia ureilytica]